MRKRIFAGSLALFFIFITSLSAYYSLSAEGKIVFVNQKPLENTFLKEYFYISGGVNTPGVYEITDNNLRIIDAINLAGGLSDNADTEAINTKINLAEFVKDADQIVIPYLNKSTDTSINTKAEKVNINTASQPTLEQLPGIGPKTAEKIIDARPYTSIEELKNIEGIGEKTYTDLKDLVTI